MSYHEAQIILDARRAGKDMPESVVLKALELTGDYKPDEVDQAIEASQLMDIQTLLDHYVKLAKEPAFKSYAWQQVNELAKELEEWRELPKMLTEAMRNEQVRQQKDADARHSV